MLISSHQSWLSCICKTKQLGWVALNDSGINWMDRQQLKQEAKQLLLKGCYRMAATKYARLIQEGAGTFSKREWAVVHLNQAICHHFQDQLHPALELCNRSIEIDPTYEKAYYRRIQILRDMKDLQTAIQSVPSWIHNQQIEKLVQQIREEHFNSLGIDSLLQDLMLGKQTTPDLLKQSHLQFYQKLLAESQKKVQPEHTKTLAAKVAKYYSQLKQAKQIQKVESFLSVLHMLLLKGHDQPAFKVFVGDLLEDFWKVFAEIGEPFICGSLTKQALREKEEYKIAKYGPSCNSTINYLQKLVTNPELQSAQLFQASIQTASNLTSLPFCSSFGSQIYQLVEKLVVSLSESMSHSKLGWLKRSFLLLDTLVRLHLHYDPTLHLTQITLTNLVYLRYSYINSKPQGKDLVRVTPLALRQMFINNLDNFFVVYVIEQIVHKLDRNVFKETIPAIEEQMDLMGDLPSIKTKNSTVHQMQKQYELVFTSLMLKLDIRHASDRINISALLSHKHNRQTIYDQSLSDMIVNALLLLGLSSNKNLIQILKHQHTLTNILHQYVECSFKQQLQSVGTATSFIYIATVDVQLQQEEIYAKKMGVNRQEIEKARKLQGQNKEPQLKVQLSQKRKEFVQYAAKHLTQTFVNLSSILLQIKDDVSLSKWSKIINEVAKADATRLHHPKVIEAMLESFKIEKEATGQFFSLLCKKINANLLKYEQMQRIVDILLYNIQNGQHELVIFQSLLSLINLTSNSNHKMKIPVKSLQNCLFQENRYINHAALELLNNVLVQCDREEIEKMVKIREVVQKYVGFYRDEVVNYQEKVPFSDYSHPSRVYSTLISVAIVMDLEGLQEFSDWSTAQKCLLRIQTPREMTLFKIVVYMGMKDRLKGKWWTHFQKELTLLQQTNKPHWLKLKQYMK